MKISEFEGGLFMFKNKLFLKIDETNLSHGICAIQLSHEGNKIIPIKLIKAIDYFGEGVIDLVSCVHENEEGVQVFKNIELNSLFMFKDKNATKVDILSLKVDPVFLNNIAEGLDLQNGEFIMYSTMFVDHIRQMKNWYVRKVIKFELN